ncbi:MAG: RNA pyrophosphohydrolase [Arcobacter butzleri]|jgi:putative (di)nucleoside polyphosphate hydrolase|nr:RNA pyrophosphohydrolase [Arcobacteraceae bacterium]MDY0364371.1 RNA pyrophosphohydrolase [Arcobacteraceae bacterium]NLO16598.1 RNA pyrophosphohydrolase [Aliarcobacter butzleri]
MEDKTKKTKNYRPNVAAIIMSPRYPHTCDVFIASRTDIDDAWQFPQGGIDEGENAKDALYRELREEIGTDEIEVIAEYPQWVSYDFPPAIAEKMKPYDGQIQKYFLVKLKIGARINIDKHKFAEFSQYKFVPIKNIFEHVTYFKRTVYKQVLKHFRKEGYI